MEIDGGEAQQWNIQRRGAEERSGGGTEESCGGRVEERLAAAVARRRDWRRCDFAVML